MADYKITYENAFQSLSAVMDSLEKGKQYHLTIEEGKAVKKRSLDANAQIHVWFSDIAKQTGESVEAVKGRCKAVYGLPILLRDGDNKPLAHLLNSSGFWNMPEPKQAMIMQCINVTSLMSTAQCNEFRDNMRAGYLEHGIDLLYLGEPPAYG